MCCSVLQCVAACCSETRMYVRRRLPMQQARLGGKRLGFRFKGGPEPLEKEIHEILGSKREDRFSDPF